MLKVAALGDIHTKTSSDFSTLFEEITQNADLFALTGDLTDHGDLDEAKHLVQQLLKYCKLPTVAVLGNHDYASGQQEEIKKALIESEVKLLDCESYIYKDVAFCGVKGFGGGFNEHLLAPFGEQPVKDFVQAGVTEQLKLEEELSRIETDKKVILLHYSPIKETVKGEPEEIYPFLGSSRLAEVVDLYNATAVFHGHAHRGCPKGQTLKGIPVYNVSLPVLGSLNKKYALIEI